MSHPRAEPTDAWRCPGPMQSLVSLCLMTLLALGAGIVLGGHGTLAASPVAASSDPAATPPRSGTLEEPVFVDSVDIRYLDGVPVPVQLDISGSLPTPCHVLAWEVAEMPDRIEVHLWSVPQESGMCIAVLEPFEASVPLGSFESASLPVSVDGMDVGRVEVDTTPNPLDDRLVGAGWSFGMCHGYCAADLVIDADGGVLLRGGDRAGDVTLFTNAGALTGAGTERIASAMASLVGVPLEAVYGCPDCADGGAAYLAISRDGAVVRHEMEFGHPPVELVELEELAMSVIDALEDCASNEFVDVAAACVAWVDPT